MSGKDVFRAARNLCCTALIALATVAAGAATTSLAQQSQGTLLVVFDSSGSMWGNLPGSSGAKFEIAHAALQKSLPGPDSGVKMGLITFGPGCTRVDAQSRPELRAPAQTLEPLKFLNPRSKGPIATALEQSLSLIEPDGPAAILLVADGPDNCTGNPCEVAERIKKERPGLRIHVVGLGLDRPPTHLACTARLTKGRFFAAETAQDTHTAIEQAVKLALKQTQVGRQRPKLTRKPARARRLETGYDPNGPSQLVLRAVLGKGGKPVDKPVRWRVFKSATEPDGSALPILDVLEPLMAVPLSAGEYFIDASLGRTRFRSKVTVAKKGPTTVKAVFNAGLVKLSVLTPRTDSGVPGMATLITVSSTGGNAEESSGARPLIVSPFRKSELILPVGDYKVRASSGPLSVEREVKVAAGSVQDVSLPLSVGELILSADAEIDGAQVEALEFKVSVDDPDSPGGRRIVARSAAPAPVFHLPAATYYVEAQAGLARVNGRVALGAGRQVRKSLQLSLARLEVEASVPLGEDSRPRPIVYKLYELNPLRTVTRSSARNPTFIVAPGKYRIVAEIGARNVRAAENVELAPGQGQKVSLGVMAGDIRLKVTSENGGAPGGQYWEVVDNSGVVVWRTQQQSPRSLLAPGRYSVRCETRKGNVEGSFEVAAGDAKTVELRIQ